MSLNQTLHDLAVTTILCSDVSEMQCQLKCNTNPFLDPEDEDSAALSTPENDYWFYRDPNGLQQGPFSGADMFGWYSAGYFEANVEVRRTSEIYFHTIGDLISGKRDDVFSTLSSATDLVPSEYLERVASSIVNPFETHIQSKTETISNSLSLSSLSDLNSDNSTAIKNTDSSSIQENRDQQSTNEIWQSERYEVDLCTRLGAIDLQNDGHASKHKLLSNSSQTSQLQVAPSIMFKISTGASKKSVSSKKQANVVDSHELKTKMRLNEVNVEKQKAARTTELNNKLQKFWLDVANTKLTATANCKSIEIRLNNVFVRGFVDPSARVSCLGVGATEFLSHHNITFHPYNASRTIINEDGTKERVLGHAFVNLLYKNMTVSNFKLIVVPNISSFLYLGGNFNRIFNIVNASPYPPIWLNVASNATRNCDQTNLHELDIQQSIRLEKVKECFPYFKKIGLGLTALESHFIEINEKQKLKGISTDSWNAVDSSIRSEIEKMLASDLIEETDNEISYWNFIVLYDQGNVSLCPDFRTINNLTRVDPYVMQNGSQILENLKKSNYFSCIDIGMILWQIPLENHSRILTTFRPDGRCYQLKRTPPQLKNSPQRIHRLLDKMLPTELREHCSIVGEKLIVSSADFEDHIAHLERLAKCLHKSGITIGSKNNFGLSSVNCFGYEVGSDSCKRNSDAYKCITSISRLSTKKQTTSFLQLLQWYRRHFNDFDKLMASLSLAEHSKNLSSNVSTTIAQIRRLLTSEPILAEPNFEVPFWIQCNASFKAIAGLLYQIAKDGSEHAIAYYFKELSKQQQQSYSVTELECFAVAASVKHFENYLDGREFFIVTDKDTINWLMTQPRHCERFARWSLDLQSFNFHILQRCDTVTDTGSNILDGITISQRQEVENTLRKFASSFRDYKNLRKNIIGSLVRFPDYKIENGLIYCRRTFNSGGSEYDRSCWKLFIPDELTEATAKMAHITTFRIHRTRREMKQFLQTQFYWANMGQDISSVLRNCSECSAV